MSNPESERIKSLTDDVSGWRRWGPYVAERAWGTVREDYSSDGNPWSYLTHDMARSKAYRWGEDGIAGLSDRYQLLTFAPAMWNGRDPILKERMFGLTPAEANHGEDVKEYYFHLDNTPSHSYMKFLYKYPQSRFPYRDLIAENERRRGTGFEYELLDTGVFDEDRYFDVVIEYAKTNTEDICIRIEAFNRGPENAELHLLPQLWFRNLWAWWPGDLKKPAIELGPGNDDFISLIADNSGCELPEAMPQNYSIGKRALYADPGGKPIFTNNETNLRRLYGVQRDEGETFTKDGFHEYLIQGNPTINPTQVGTKAAIHYHFPSIPAGESVFIKLRLTDNLELDDPLKSVDSMIGKRKQEADEFYDEIYKSSATPEERQLQRSAFAGLLWSKQIYLYDVSEWLAGDDPSLPPDPKRKHIRNEHWKHLNSKRIMAMPDTWEYPWFAAWDLAFHAVTFALIDAKFAKEQLCLLLFEQFQHPNGQIPAYEWEFSDLNPPVHAWAVWRVYNMDRIRSGKADFEFLERCFHKLMINFGWWVNNVDSEGNNVFEGGFLGLDNITVVDRSQPFADGATLEQADATGWMGMFCLQMMRMALELATKDPVYEGLAIKYFQHYVYVAAAMKNMGSGNDPLWDDEDGFFYDVLRMADGTDQRFRVRSLVGLIPLYAVERLEMKWIEPFTEFKSSLDWFLRNRRDLVEDVVHRVEHDGETTLVLTIVNAKQLTRILDRVWNEDEFLSPYGIRSLSKFHQQHPFVFDGSKVGYEPAEAISKIKGGNSNWRGPIWFPTSFLLIESLRKLGKAFGPAFVISPPAMGGRSVTLHELAGDLASRLQSIFMLDEQGQRPVYGGIEKFQQDPHWRELMLFYEYFHGDNGAGLGASHQTGWTALVANLIDEWAAE